MPVRIVFSSQFLPVFEQNRERQPIHFLPFLLHPGKLSGNRGSLHSRENCRVPGIAEHIPQAAVQLWNKV